MRESPELELKSRVSRIRGETFPMEKHTVRIPRYKAILFECLVLQKNILIWQKNKSNLRGNPESLQNHKTQMSEHIAWWRGIWPLKVTKIKLPGVSQGRGVCWMFEIDPKGGECRHVPRNLDWSIMYLAGFQTVFSSALRSKWSLDIKLLA